MALDLAKIAGAIKEHLEPKVSKVLETSHETWGRVKKGSADETNNRAAGLVVISKNHAIQLTTSSEGAAFPDASQLEYAKMTVAYTKLYRTVEITGDLEAHDSSSNAVAKFIRDLFMNTAEAMDKWINRQLVSGDGSGEIARVSAINTGTRTITCAGTINLFGVRKIEPGMQLESRTTGGALRSGGAVSYLIVETVDRENKLFTYTAAQGAASDIAATDILVDRNSYNTAPKGLLYHIAKTGSYQGITRGATSPWANAVVQNEGGSYLQASSLDKLLMNMKIKVGKSNLPSGLEILWSVQEDAYKLLGYSLKDFTGTNLNMGWTGVTHGNINTRFDNDVAIDTLFAWYPDSIQRFDMPKRKLGMLQVGDQSGPFLQKHNGSVYMDAKQAFMGGFFEFGMRTPHVNALMNALATSGLADGNVA